MKGTLQYKTEFQGLSIAIETRKNQFRYWYDPTSKERGSTKMEYPYGYVEGTLGLDGDAVDVFLGTHKDSDRVFVITQMKRFEFKTIDEQKVMLGFNNPIEAKTAYLNHFNNARFFGTIQEMTVAEFKEKLSSCRGKLIKSESPLLNLIESAKMERNNMDFYVNKPAGLEKHQESHTDFDDTISSLKKAQEVLNKAKASINTEDMDLKKTEKGCSPDEMKEEEEAEKSLSEVSQLMKALKAAAVAGLGRKEILNAIYQTGMAASRYNSPMEAEPVTLDHDQLNLGSKVQRPLYEPRSVPVRRVESPGYIPPKECDDVTYKSAPVENQEALPIWRRG